MKSNIKKLHTLALAYLDVLIAIQGTATKGIRYHGYSDEGHVVWEKTSQTGSVRVALCGHVSFALANALAIAAAHNTQPALLAIAKHGLTRHFDMHNRHVELPDAEHRAMMLGYHKLEHHAICTQLASDGHECEQLQALKEALSEK